MAAFFFHLLTLPLPHVSIRDGKNYLSFIFFAHGEDLNTDGGELILVEGISLKDYADGKRLFSRFSKAVDHGNGVKYSELIAMGVIEGGTESGKPTCMFLSREEASNEARFYVFEISLEALRSLTQAAQKCDEYFLTPEGMTQ